MSAIVTMLRAAGSRIADRERWTQGAVARDANGALVLPSATTAVCWCAEGALIAEGTRTRAYDVESLARNALRAAISAERVRSITSFNDRSTHAEVLDLFERAIAAEEARAA